MHYISLLFKRRIVNARSIIITDNGETAAVAIENNENNIRNERDFVCNICNKTFKMYRGLNQHIRSCLAKTHNNVALCTSQPTSNNIYQDTVREVNNDLVQEVNNDLVCEVNNDPVRAINNDSLREVNNDLVREVNNDPV